MLNRWFLTDDIPLALCTPYRHSAWLVALSYLVAAFAAYTAFHLIGRVQAAASRTSRLAWLTTAGLSMGFGIWAMHFIAMLAVEIPIAIRFDIPVTALSAGFAVAASVIAFHFVANDRANRLRLGLAGGVLGTGIGLMHYVGMSALRMPAHIYYDPWLFALSVAVAIVLATVALYVLTFRPPLSAGHAPLARVIGAAVMGLAIVLMHYTGMFATYFYPEPGLPASGALLDPPVMAATIGMTTLAIGVFALAAALFDTRVQRAEALLRDAIDSMSEGFVIYDQADRLIMCNEGFRAIYRKSADAIVPGTAFADILRAGLARQEFADAIGREEAWLQERLHEHREGTGATEQQLGDGQWVLVTERRMRNGCISGLRVNISALKQAEARLRDSEERLDRAQAIAGIGSWELDVPAGRYVWSKELYRIRGLSPDTFEPYIDSVAAYVHPDDDPMVRRWLANLKSGMEHDAIEVRVRRPDGTLRTLRVEGRAVAEADGTVRRIAGTMQDITERRLIEQQLAQAQKMEAIGNLTGGMAHDFNNVLAVVIGNLELLRRSVRDDPRGEQLRQDAIDGALRGADLTRRLLAVARRQPLHPQQTDVNALVEGMTRLLSRTLGENVELESHLDPKLPPILVDPTQLEAALLNLATNARDAMPRGGRLDITTGIGMLDAQYAVQHTDVRPGEYVIIAVSDTGTGIPPEVAGRIFEPFFTTKEHGRGSGLGLSMVFGFIKQSGGHVAVYSEPYRGTTFRLYLRPDRSGKPAITEEADHLPMVGGDETLLVVEDNAPLRRAAVQQLTALGYRVHEAENASAALHILAADTGVDLLFTDVVMPGGVDGIDLARQATAMRPRLKVLLTSGFPDVKRAAERMTEGRFSVLQKPYRYEDLASALRDRLDAQEMARIEG